MWMSSHVTDSGLWKKDAIMIIISPLVALMKDQVNRLNAIRLKAAYVGCEAAERGICNGEFTYVFMSPESSLSNEQWRCMLEKKSYQERLVGIAIDEAHCIVEWGTSSNNKKNTAFRIWYSRLNELRSLVGKGVSFMALTATATKRTKRQIFDMLELINPFEVVDNPNRPNICFVVQKMDNSIQIGDHFKFLINDLKEHREKATRTIIYCQTIKQCAVLFDLFRTSLGIDLYCDGSVDPRMRFCDMMHSNSPESVKNHILDQFSQSESHLRVLIATIAYGMGVNCKNVCRVIHFGPSKSVEAYMQESGRCGRNGEQSSAILFYNSVTIRAADRDMKDYIHSDSCRRQELINHFSHSAGIEKPQGHLCCDICAAKCASGEQLCKSDVFLPVSNGNDKSNIRIRNVSDTESKSLEQD